MSHILIGRLRGYLCDDCIEPLSNVTVRLYRVTREQRPGIAVGGADPEPRALTEAEVEEKRPLLLGEGQTDWEGNFSVQISENSRFEGGPVEVDVYCATVPRLRPDRRERKPVQFTAAVIEPNWRRAEGGAVAHWKFDLRWRLWCFIRGLFDAWVICGRLVTCKGEIPIAGAEVRAFDADWLQDDSLGMDTTDSGGHFRIDYTSAQFRKTPFSPWLNVELTEGPDLYFKVSYGGNPVMEETQSDGRARGRENVRHCYCVRLCTDKVKVLACDLTGPTDCVHGDRNILPPKVLERVTGTAAGTVFARYELEVRWNGTLLITNAVIYSDAGGNPDPAATQGTHQVVNGTLGFLDLQELSQQAGGGNLVDTTEFEVRLRVFGAAEEKICSRIFAAAVGNVYIKSIGGATAAHVLPPDEPLTSGGSVASVASVGGSVGVRGAADVFGCDHEKIERYRIWIQSDPTFTLPQPNDGDAFAPAAWHNITDITYATDEQRSTNRLDGLPDPELLTRSGWGSQEVCFTIFGSEVCFTVPYLIPSAWPTKAGVGGTPQTGKFSVLLEVIDSDGNTYYDIQRVWVDNEDVVAAITGIGGLMPCMDLYMKEKTPPHGFRTVDVEGTAWDALIVAGDQNAPSENFDEYVLDFQKQGAAGWQPFETSSSPVPARPALVGVGVLKSWNLRSLDRPSNPEGYPLDQLLNPNESCAYVVRLRVSDRTLVGDSSATHYDEKFFPVKIINAPEP
jgi:hypothetical protein